MPLSKMVFLTIFMCFLSVLATERWPNPAASRRPMLFGQVACGRSSVAAMYIFTRTIHLAFRRRSTAA